MSIDLPTAYDPRTTEPEIWKRWTAGPDKPFAARPRSDAAPFTVVIPPPNVTGALHMGHALNNTLQDILVRRARMQGRDTLWMPGTDHAGIATQSVVERQIKARECKTRHDLGREELVRRIWAWKEQYGGRIIGQLHAMGCSCDWDRTAFTLDEKCSRAVRETFFRLFRDGLIFRGKRMVNWDPVLQTAVADDELEDKEIEGRFHYIRYPLADGPLPDGTAFVTVATTRPETMLGDTAVAMNPRDPRAGTLTGRRVRLPLTDRTIPIIADEHVVLPDANGTDSKARMSTGFLKVTPAHDPHDYEIGQRHALPMINILRDDGTLNGNVPAAYQGLDRFEARKRVLADLETQGLLEKVEPYAHTVPHSQRSGSPIEPYLSDQWFVKMSAHTTPDGRAVDLAEAAMSAVRDGRVKIHPERFARTYLDWLGQKRDWCISRQLWWGHRIPIWHFRGTQEAFGRVAAEVAARLPGRTAARWNAEADTPTGLICSLEDLPADLCEATGLSRDPDVLDTWFSSALWPFSTLGWPSTEVPTGEAEPSWQRYYPGQVLVTSRDIITLWVARMVMAGLYDLGDVPFRDVVIHAKIMDGFGETMSKSKGNGIDPLDIIGKYGADGMRFTLASMATETQDIRLPVGYLSPHDGETIVPQEKQHQKPEIKKLKCPKTGKDFAIPKPLSEPPAGMPVAITVSDRFDYGRNFANKLYNAARFAMMNLASAPAGSFEGPLDTGALRLEDRWVLARLDETARRIDNALAGFNFAEAASAGYTFFWDDFCAWYLELVKPRLRTGGRDGTSTDDAAGEPDRRGARRVLAYVLDSALRLLHPIIPFVTEHLWGLLRSVCPQRSLDGKPAGEDGLLTVAKWPVDAAATAKPAETDGAATLAGFGLLQDVVRTIRNVRTQFKLAPGKPVDALLRTGDGATADFLLGNGGVIQALAGVGTLTAGPQVDKPAGAATQVIAGMQVFVPLAGLVDLAAERERITKEREKTAASLTGLETRLANEGFLARAKPEVIEAEKRRRDELREKVAAFDRNLAELA